MSKRHKLLPELREEARFLILNRHAFENYVDVTAEDVDRAEEGDGFVGYSPLFDANFYILEPQTQKEKHDEIQVETRH